MSTRCNIVVKDEHSIITLYRHCDGYPDGVLPDLLDAFPLAWEPPRFEADEFAAAIVAAWKTGGGGNICIDGSSEKPEALLHGDIEYWYLVTGTRQGISVEVHTGRRSKIIGTVELTPSTTGEQADKLAKGLEGRDE